MNDIATRTTQLPDTLEDLSQFVLVSKAKLDAYKVKLRAVNRLSDAQEIREQTFQEAQEVANALIAAEARIGEILLSIPKSSGGVNQYNKEENSERLEKSKAEVTEEMGYTRHEVSDYQRMAQNPSVVNLVLEQAEREGKIVSHAQVMKKIKEKDAEIERLHNDNKILARRAEPTVIEKTVEVIPDDYEELKRKTQTYEADNTRLNREYKQVTSELADAKRQLKEAQSTSTEDKVVQSAKDSMDNFSIATYDFIRRYGGNVWSFDKWADVPDSTRTNFAKAIQALSAFAQQMADNIAGIE